MHWQGVHVWRGGTGRCSQPGWAWHRQQGHTRVRVEHLRGHGKAQAFGGPWGWSQHDEGYEDACLCSPCSIRLAHLPFPIAFNLASDLKLERRKFIFSLSPRRPSTIPLTDSSPGLCAVQGMPPSSSVVAGRAGRGGTACRGRDYNYT